MSNRSDDLFRQVAWRKRLASLARWAYRITLGLAVVYALLLLSSRLLALLPDWYSPVTVLLVPVVAVLAALLLHRGITRAEAARLIDVRMQTKDLYLTAATAEDGPFEYKPLVNESAESQAPSIRPATVVPFDPWTRALHIIVALALLLVGATWLPSFDPFGKEEQRQQVAQRIKTLQEEKIEAQKKVEFLKKQDVDSKTSEEVEQALNELKKTFNEMKKDKPKANLDKLQQQQKKVGEMWQKAKEKSLKDQSRENKMAQKLGTAQDQLKMQEWKKDLGEGNAEKMKQQMEDVKKLAEQMKNAESELEKQALEKQMQQKLQELSDFAKSNASSEELANALDKAMEQLQQAGDQQTQQEALDALREQMGLSQQELEKMAQSIRDQKELEEMLKSIQQAKQANSQGKADGSQCEGCKTLEDYQKMFQQMAGGQGQGQDGEGNGSSSADTQNAGNGQGNGNGQQAQGQGGTGGAGQGRGGQPPEASGLKTTFKSEKVKSALQAGKILMQWKTQELAEPGEAKVEYAEQVDRVKEGVGEAILQEEIPPGYHKAIQDYFDNYKAEAAKDGGAAKE